MTLRAFLVTEIAREDANLVRVRTDGFMGDQAYMIGLTRNAVRREILAKMDESKEGNGESNPN